MNTGKPDYTAKMIYHITHIKNLESIIKEGGILSDAEMQTRGIEQNGIAYSEIKERRRRISVQISRGGHLSDYVPLFFAPRQPMLYVLSEKRVPCFQENEDRILHLEICIANVITAHLDYCFTDGHAAMLTTNYYQTIEHLEKIDWDLMHNNSWHDREDDPNRQQRREAEFLIWNRLPWDLISLIGTKNAKTAREVNDILTSIEIRPKIKTAHSWYYKND